MPGEPCAKIDGITCIRWAARGWWQHMQQGVGHEQGPAAMAVSLARAVDTTVHLPMPGLSPWPCRNRQTMVTTLGADLAAFQPAPPAAEPVMPAGAWVHTRARARHSALQLVASSSSKLRAALVASPPE